MLDKNTTAYKEAKKRVDQLKGFYVHLLVYVIINGFFSLNVVIREYFKGVSIQDSMENFSFFSLWFFWGIGLFFHGLGVFKSNFLFSKEWEQRKINAIMEQDNSQDNSSKNQK